MVRIFRLSNDRNDVSSSLTPSTKNPSGNRAGSSPASRTITNILYEVLKMAIAVETKKLIITERIALLQARGSHNDRIVNKLKRRLRNLDK